MGIKSRFLTIAGAMMLGLGIARATSNHEYYPDEYDTVAKGISPDGKYAITAHGSSDNYGYTAFNIYLTDNVDGKKIGPLQEVSDNLDTGSDAYAAKWSADSKFVYIVYRISRQEPLQVMSYHIEHHRAFPLTETHVDATNEQIAYWQKFGASTARSVKIFGKPNLNQYLKTIPEQ